MEHLKMYVLVREDISKSWQTVQACHAVAEYLLNKPDKRWLNGTMVVLGVKNEDELIDWHTRILDFDAGAIIFHETVKGQPFGYTAVCAVGGKALSEKLNELDLLN